MRILIAPDAFKGSLSSAQAAAAMAAGIRNVMPTADIEMLPLADGGEGTLDVLAPYVTHEKNIITNEKYLIYKNNIGENVEILESARFIGLTQPQMQALDIYRRGSGALGECIRQALNTGIRRFVIALGGSATSDAGLGLLTSLGLHAMNDSGGEVTSDLQGLFSVNALDISDMDTRLADSHLTVLCDVNSPLCGGRGAAFTYGPQKGLPATDVGAVDRAMERFARLAETAFGCAVKNKPGSGAAGGLGFALALLGGELVSGADYVIEHAGLAAKIAGCDWVITGEGRSDAQTLTGKLPSKVAKLARASGVRVALISGDVADMPMLANAFDTVIAARPQNMSVEMAMDQATLLLHQAACIWAEAT